MINENVLASLNIIKSPFKYHLNAFGGTEYMGRGFEKYIAPYMEKLEKYTCIIMPGVSPSPDVLLNSFKPIIYWLHNTPIQFGDDFAKFLSLPEMQEKIAYIVVVSESAKQEVLSQTTIPEEKIIIIPNAIDPLEYKPEKFKNIERIKLINTSSPDRGIDILLNAIDIMDEDFHIDIFSRFNPLEMPDYKPDPRITFYGFSYKETVKEYYEQAHIHAYPSTYPETFCLSQAESMSAGLLCVTPDLGALSEISNQYTKIYKYEKDKEKHVKVFAEQLSQAIQNIKSESWDPREQIQYINKTYSWESIKKQWLDFHKLI